MSGFSNAPGPDPLLGSFLAERYYVERILGRGGMGTVYLARQLGLDRAVAVKVLSPEFVRSNRESERFRREALAMARLRHPNIVTVHDFGVTAEGRAYLVMEYLAGPTLERWLTQHGAADPVDAVDVLKPICMAIDASHRTGIVHRDLKPSNIILPDPGDPDDVVRVVDFGIARLRENADADITGSVILGTPAYMAPEQSDASRADYRSDIYSLGVIAFEVLTGERPFRAPSARAVLLQHFCEPAPPATRVRPDLPAAVDAVLMRALDKDPANRHESARDFAHDLARALGVASYDDQLRHLRTIAERDELTGLYNRRSFYARLATAKGRADRDRVPFALAIFDVDDFKSVNDNFGHLAGDDVLRRVAEALTVSARDEDAPCRYAGDEFALILEASSRDAAERVVAEIARRVREDAVLGAQYGTSLSAGVTLYEGTGEAPEIIVGTADRALYFVKQRGKDGLEFLPVDAASALLPSHDPTLVATDGMGLERTFVPENGEPRRPRGLDFDNFVGREREVTILRDAVERARGGGIGAALVVGDPGIGKSALVERVLAAVPDVAVIEARFIEGAVAPPYRSFVDPLGAFLMGRSFNGASALATPAESRALNAISRGDTAEFTEALGLGSSEADRFRAFEVLRRAFRRIARDTLVVLVAEDLQWADSLSLEFLSYLISGSGDTAVFVVATARADAITDGSPLRAWARGMTRTDRFVRVELAPLRPSEVRSLIASICGRVDQRVDVADAVVERLARETEGNPLHISEVLRLWVADGTLSYNADADSWCVRRVAEIVLPPSISELFEARLTQTDERVVEALRTAAVVGEEFSLDTLAAVDGREEDDLLDLLDDAIRDGLIVEVRDRREDVFRFSHAIVRRVLESSLSGARRRRLHAKIAAALEARAAAGRQVLPGALARHFLGARMPERALPYALDAARLAWRGWAIEQTEEALSSIEEAVTEGVNVPNQLVAHAALLRGETEAMRGRVSAARTGFECAIDLVEAAGLKAPRLKTRALRNLGRLLAESGESDAAIARLLEALRLAETGGLEAEVPRLRVAIGHTFDHMGEFERAIEWIESALALAEARGDRAVQMLAETARGRCLSRMGRFAAAREAGLRARELATAVGDRKREWEALNLIGVVYHEQADYVKSYEFFTLACDVARSIGDAPGEVRMLTNIGETHRRAGHFDDAIACYEQILAIAPELPARSREGLAVNLALAHAGLGDAAAARRHVEEARRLNESTADQFSRAYVAYTLAEVLLLERAPSEARDAARSATELARAIRSPEVEWQALWAEARALRALGSLVDARKTIDACTCVLESMAAQLDAEEDRARFLADKRHVYAAGEELDAAIFGDEPYESFGRPC